MTTRLALTLIIGFGAVLKASDNSIEVTLEDTPEHQESSQTDKNRWKFRPQTATKFDWNDFMHWRNKFWSGSEKQLGSAADRNAIKALVPLTMPPIIRWISRSVVVVSADCYSDRLSSGRVRCLYVLEKHRSSWKVAHHFSEPPISPTILRSNQSLQPTTDR